MDNIFHWKNRGNQFFKLNDILKAINCWEEALQLLKDYDHDLQSMKDLTEVKKKQEDSLGTKISIFGNLALGHMKRNEIDEAEFYNSSQLALDPENIKGQYRVIQIHILRNELKEAQEYAIKCTSKFKTEKSFKEILTGEIAEKIRAKTDSQNVEE